MIILVIATGILAVLMGICLYNGGYNEGYSVGHNHGYGHAKGQGLPPVGTVNCQASTLNEEEDAGAFDREVEELIAERSAGPSCEIEKLWGGQRS